MEEKLFCRKCFVPDYVKEPKKFLDTYLKGLSPGDRVADDVYNTRLKMCGRCPYYINGMCRLCGCFVAIRAAGRAQYCPDSPQKWGR